jgi:uracil phosphoribosyltransferase
MFKLTDKPSIANHFLAELRDFTLQKDRMRFRKNLERLGEIFAYEISKTLPFREETITTPLGTKHTQLLVESPVLLTIMRAGLPLHQGMLNFFDKADNAFIGAYRGKHDADEHFEIEMDYMASPNLDGKILILCDPMLATGKSIEKTYNAILRYGTPAKTYIVSVIASAAGIRHIENVLPQCQLWIGDVDDELNAKSYIIPGLGDAGDLSFGEKM